MIDNIAVMFKRKRIYNVYGTQGGLSTKEMYPVNFNPATDKCPMVILMHGFMSSKRLYPIPNIMKSLASAGIASISFDFNAHGKSEGSFVNMTISSEISDAKAVYDYVASLPHVSSVALLGHSQGGVIAGMVAGQLEESASKPVCVVQMAPAAVLKDDAIAGQCMGKKYDPANPPEYVNVFFHKLGRPFIKEAQTLPIYEISSKYSGKVCLIHGKKDKIVPFSYSEKYSRSYKDSVLYLLDEEGHMMNKNKKEIVGLVTSFLKENLIK